MTYSSWITVHIINKTGDSILQVRNAEVSWGKFYKTGDKDHEISAADVNKTTVAIDGSADVSSCGRSDSPSGTTGSIELWSDEINICKITWDCPWGNQPNDFNFVHYTNYYSVQRGDWNQYGDGIGTVNVEIGHYG